MGVFKDLINNFIEPKPEEKSFKVLCGEVGLSEEATKALNESMKGLSWDEFSGKDAKKGNKKGNKKKVREFSTGRIQKAPKVSSSSRKEGIEGIDRE